MKKINDIYSTISLRYETPVSADAANNARIYALQNKNDNCSITYWCQSTVMLQTEYSQLKSNCLWYSGNGLNVYPAKFVAGTYPALLAENEICVSSSLAWQLWGNIDATGFEVSIDEKTYTVSGVFEEDKALAMASCGLAPIDKEWQAVELYSINSNNKAEFAQSFASASGLGIPESVVYNIPNNIAFLLAILPTIFLAVAFLISSLIYFIRSKKVSSKIILLCIFILFALLLPQLLSLLPANIIPGRWSDFSYWGKLAKQEGGNFLNWVNLRPLYPDAKAKILLNYQFLISFAATIANVFLFNIKRTSK